MGATTVPDGDYIQTTSFASTLSSAMNDFHEALTYRWREVVTEKIQAFEHDFPQRIQRDGSPFEPPLWEYWTAAAVHHLRGAGHPGCSYVHWVEGGQEGSLSSVTCPGLTGADEEVQVIGPYGEPETVPPKIECGMGSILEQVENWAWGERDHVYYELPLFDTHDMDAIKAAHDAFIKVGGELGLEAAKGSDPTVSGNFHPTSERELAGKIDDLSAERGEGQDWWAGWTGLAANRAKAGFFSSVTPTANNQSGILGSLANLYSVRGTIIEKGRNDGLYWIQWATKSLKDTQKTTTNLVPGWKVVQGVGTAITISGGWSGVGAAVGAGVILAGFVGENLFGSVETEGYAHGLEEVVNKLNTKIGDLNEKLSSLELDYASKVSELQTTIFGIHSFNLELYDLTENKAEGDDPGGEGYTADIEDILAIARACYDTGEGYDGLWPKVAHTSKADKHMADKDGNATSADTSLLETRDMLEGFIKTACARYLLAGDEVKKAAENYANLEDGRKAAYNRIMDDWDDADVGEYDPELNPGKEADDTDRSGYDPYEGHPALGGGEPGANDGQDYETEKDE